MWRSARTWCRVLPRPDGDDPVEVAERRGRRQHLDPGGAHAATELAGRLGAIAGERRRRRARGRRRPGPRRPRARRRAARRSCPATPPPITSTSAWRRRYSVRHSRSRLAAAQPAEAGGVAQHLLVERPQPARPDEGLVVEAGRRQPAAEDVGGPHRRRSAATGRAFMCSTSIPSRTGSVQARTPGPAVDLDEAVRALAGAAEEAARAVVLEAAREHPLAGGVQGRADRVALERLDRLAVEAERDRPLAVDPLAGAGGEAAHRSGRPTQRTSLVVVSRSARNQARQPER